MITDRDTNFLFLSERLQLKCEFFARLQAVLIRNGIKFRMLPHTNDIWAVDYMPIQTDVNTFIQFRYEPDYLQGEKYQHTLTDPVKACKEIGLNPQKSNIKIDGGNVIKGETWIILTDKIFSDNPGFTKTGLTTELERLFKARIVIIPREPYDYIGHADGMVRYYDDKTVLVNSYRSPYDKPFGDKLRASLTKQGLKMIEIPYNPYTNRTFDMTNGLYINFLQMKNFTLVPTFGLKQDQEALSLFQKLFPTSIVDAIDSSHLAKDGGVLNCISWNIKVK